jgi:ketosteroid isomerase-like protein
MKTRNVIAALGLIAAAFLAIPAGDGAAAQTEREKPLASLIEAERAFSRTSEEKGIREAFLKWLAADATVFRPAPVPGRPVYENMDPADPAVLTWEPEAAEIAASGEMGYTSGPYVLRPRRDAEPAGFGHYVSVWKKQPDGAWRVLLDIGVPHDRPASSAPITDVAAPLPGGDFEALSLEAHRDEFQVLANLMGHFDAQAGMRGYRGALTEFATSDIRIYRPGRMPAVGKSLIKKMFPDDEVRAIPPPGPVPEGRRLKRQASFQVELAWSGDLAVTYGTADRPKDPSAARTVAFLNIWRKGRPAGPWKICLDIELPVPADKEKKG